MKRILNKPAWFILGLNLGAILYNHEARLYGFLGIAIILIGASVLAWGNSRAKEKQRRFDIINPYDLR